MVNRRRRAGRAAVALVERVKRWVLRRRHVMSLYRRVRGGGDSRLEGDDSLPIGPPGATLTGVRWTESGTLELAGERRAAADVAEVVVRGRSTLREHAFRTTDGGEPGHFTAELDVARIESLGGALPLREDTYDLCLRPTAAANARRGSVALAERVLQALPLERVVDHKPLALGMTRSGRAVLKVGRDLDDDERGPRQQRRLRETVYLARRREPLSDAVVYSSFRGRQYSDNPRAVHEELLRRAAPLEHLWVVRDAQCRVPETATVVREGSRDHYEALARARFVVCNDHFSEWFARRPDQVSLQTWHGTPLKRLGFDVSRMRNEVRRFEHDWRERVRNWQYVLSPNRFTTPILRRAYAIEGEILETGYPRNDVLAGPDRDVLSRQLRRRLGIPEDVRVVLYAPTYRDGVRDSRKRYRLDLQLDLDMLRSSVGKDAVVLFRKHHYIVDPVPETADGFVRDVSSYPDGTELMLAADVLVTDYSSMMFDFANTGRPMLFFTYDLDAYRDEVRGFYFDFENDAPGPLLRTTEELVDALGDIDAVMAAHASRYQAFASTFCALDDGHAAARVVDALFAV